MLIQPATFYTSTVVFARRDRHGSRWGPNWVEPGAFAFTNELSTFAGYEMLKYVSFPVQVAWTVRWSDVLLPVKKVAWNKPKAGLWFKFGGMLEEKTVSFVAASNELFVGPSWDWLQMIDPQRPWCNVLTWPAICNLPHFRLSHPDTRMAPHSHNWLATQINPGYVSYI